MKGQDQAIAKLGRAWAALSAQSMPQNGCPKTDEVWDAIHGRLPLRQTRRIVDHLEHCPACAEAWRLARLLKAEAESPHTIVRPRRTGSRRSVWATAAAVAAALLLALGLQLGTDLFSPNSPGFREAESTTIHSLLPEEEAIPRDRFLLRWTAAAAGEPVRYRLIVTTESLQVVAEEAGLLETHYQVPEAMLNQLNSGMRLRWQVHATLDNGKQISSPTFSSRIQ